MALSVVDHERPYRSARVRGRVVEKRTGDAALEVMDRLALRHGKPFPVRQGVLYLVEPEHAGFMELPFQAERRSLTPAASPHETACASSAPR